MITFNIWLEAIMNRSVIPMDQEDIKYLKQVSREFWKDALKHRYNDFLIKAVEDLEANRPMQDIQSTTLQGYARRVINVELNTGMTKLIKKLQRLGFDLSDPQQASSTLGSMHLMNSSQAGNIIKNWIAQNPNGELMPGFKQYTPNKLQSQVNSMDDVMAAERKFANIKPQIEQVARKMIDKKLQTLADPNHPYHINYYYWSERKDELLQGLFKAVKDNLNEPSERYYNVMANKITSFLQTGHVNKRLLDRAKENGIDVGFLLKKGYTIQQITDAFANAGGRNRYSQYKFNLVGPPQQQDFLKTIHQSVPTPAAGINNYGRNTLAKKRKKATGEILQGTDTSSNVGTYTLAPTESFKDWLVNYPDPKEVGAWHSNSKQLLTVS